MNLRNPFVAFKGIPVICLITILYYCAENGTSSSDLLSVTTLENYLLTEKVLLSNFKKYFRSSKQYRQDLEKEISNIEKDHKLAEKDIDDFITNPVNVFKLIRRLLRDWTSYGEEISKKNEFKQLLDFMKSNLDLPSEEELEHAGLTILRLQYIYNLNVGDLAAGLINGVKNGYGMSWADCLALAQLALDKRALQQGIYWLDETVKRINSDAMQTSEEFLLAVTDFEEYLERMNDLEYMKTVRDENVFLLPDDDEKQRRYYYYNEFRSYRELCQAKASKSAANRSLKCYYHWGHGGFYRLAPFKAEDISIDPVVKIFHNMVNDKQIDRIIELAGFRMMQSAVYTDFGVRRTSHRISSSTFIDYKWHLSIRKIIRDLHGATGLDMKQNEPMQVASYAAGGYYQPHLDCFPENHLPAGDKRNRISTSMIYLTDVKQGGATIFPFLGIHILPSKGDVVFWYNLHRSLDLDYRTLHAGCPVLRGSKWIANIWTRDRFQDKIRPCGLLRDNEISLKYKEFN